MIADVFQRVSALGTLADVDQQIGDAALAENRKSPSATWVLIGDSFRRGSIRTPNAPALPRALYTRMTRVNVHLSSKSDVANAAPVDEIRALELLQNRFIAAIHSIGFGTFTLGGTTYPATEGQSVAEFGRKCVLSVTWETPVYSPDDGTRAVVITTEQIEMEQRQPDGTGGTIDPTINQP